MALQPCSAMWTRTREKPAAPAFPFYGAHALCARWSAGFPASVLNACTSDAVGADREIRRRMAKDDDLVDTPPSSLDLDRSASAVRTGRSRLRSTFDEHTDAGPDITGGDVDAD